MRRLFPKLDFEALARRSDEAIRNIQNRGLIVDVEHILKLKRDMNALATQRQKLEAERNLKSKCKDIEAGKRIKKELQDLKDQEHMAQEELFKLAVKIPNWTHPSSPVGKHDQAVVMKLWQVL